MLKPASDEDATIMYFRSEKEGIATVFTQTQTGNFTIEIVEYEGNFRNVLGTAILSKEKAKRIGDWIKTRWAT